MGLPIGIVLNQRYRIVRLLGQGGFGAVYRAWDQNLNVPCAVKENLDVSQEAARQFGREAQILASLRHPNLPRVTDHFSVPGQGQYLVMEYIEGEDLNEKRTQYGGRQPLDQVLGWLDQILSALEYLHSQEPPIVHRDIKPANIRVTPYGQAFLVDFGIAKIFDPQLKTSLGARAITPGFSPIEQYGHGTTDPRSDIYALGATVYTLLSGEVPPESTTRSLNDRLPPLNEINRLVPPYIADSIRKSMKVNPDERWQSIREMRDSLKSGPLPVIVTEPAKVTAPMLASTPPITKADHDRLLDLSQRGVRAAAETEVIPRSDRATGVISKPRKKSLLMPLLMGGGGIIAIVIVIGILGFLFNYLKSASQVEPTQTATIPFASVPTARAAEIPTKVVPIEPPPIQPFPGEPIRIGLLAPLGGAVPEFGISLTEGVRLAVEQWNSRNGMLGRPIDLIVADSRCEADPAIHETNRLIDQEHIRFIIGDVCSKASIPVSDVVNEKKVLQISPSSTNPLVTQNPSGTTKPFTFRDCFVDSFQGHVMAKFSIEKGFRTAFVIFDRENDYSISLADTFKRSFVDFGGEIVGGAEYTAGQEDFSKILNLVANSRAQMVFIPGYYDSLNKIGRQIKDRNLDVVMMGGDGWESPGLDLGAVEGGFYSTHFNPEDTRPSVREWIDLYSNTYRTPDGKPKIPDAIATLGYETANLLFTAIEKTGVDDPVRVAELMAHTEFEGVTGVIRFDEFHNPQKSVVVMGIFDGGLHFIQTVFP